MHARTETNTPTHTEHKISQYPLANLSACLFESAKHHAETGLVDLLATAARLAPRLAAAPPAAAAVASAPYRPVCSGFPTRWCSRCTMRQAGWYQLRELVNRFVAISRFRTEAKQKPHQLCLHKSLAEWLKTTERKRATGRRFAIRVKRL
jgi:crotonobetainyl-CoA:carnitine CoA-transferase CaiB-like acyl-CoA transferase